MSQIFLENQSWKNYGAFKITISYTICIAEKFVKSSRTMQAKQFLKIDSAQCTTKFSNVFTKPNFPKGP